MNGSQPEGAMDAGMTQLWRNCGANVAQLWTDCGAIVARMWRNCGPTVAQLWRDRGGFDDGPRNQGQR